MALWEVGIVEVHESLGSRNCGDLLGSAICVIEVVNWFSRGGSCCSVIDDQLLAVR